ncbi:MAG: flagellar protein export ATPase FliI [Gudongella sp.]|nr:flagellar protein export ATPase FliI [Gudongella sp.]
MVGLQFDKFGEALNKREHFSRLGKVTQVVGIIIWVEGIEVYIGEVCEVFLKNSKKIVLAEVVAFKDSSVLLMPLDELQGIGPGAYVKPTGRSLTIRIGSNLLGRTLDGLGRPMDGGSIAGGTSFSVDRSPPNPFLRKKIDQIMSTGIKAIDGLLTCGEGQRIGIFAGSGVGKSTLLGMIARYSQADVNVIALVGERGREVLEFIEKDLGPDGYEKSVVIVATSDQPPLVRLKASFVATAVAEYYRDQGLKVMLMMDSVTRFAMSQREIGLATGEPPTTKGYTPSVFAILPKLLERSGTSDKGSITAFYTVLVEGDDMNDPIADAVRGILDGHIILSRKIAAKNHFPAIDIQNSVSRVMTGIVDEEHRFLAGELKEYLAVYEESEDLINIGAYNKGTNPKIDRSIELNAPANDFLKQQIDERFDYIQSRELLEAVINGS